LKEDEVYKATISAFQKLSVAEFTSAIMGSPVTSARYAALSTQEQAQVAAEIEERALKVATRVADVLRRRGLLDGNADRGTVNQIYREALEEFARE
jgi:WPP domain